MTAAACVSHASAENRRLRVGVPQNFVGAVAIGAYRGLPDSLRQRLAVNTRFELRRDIAVAHTALIRQRLAERFKTRFLQLMRAAMAVRTGWSQVAFLCSSPCTLFWNCANWSLWQVAQSALAIFALCGQFHGPNDRYHRSEPRARCSAA